MIATPVLESVGMSGATVLGVLVMVGALLGVFVTVGVLVMVGELVGVSVGSSRTL
jgi:hypothetical protein